MITALFFRRSTPSSNRSSRRIVSRRRLSNATDGIARGTDVVDTGGPITVPVGDITLGRVWNVLGDPVDEKEPAPADAKLVSLGRKLFFDKILSADRISTHYLAGVAAGAVINRGNVTTGSFGIELNNADGVTISNLSITGAYEGIFVNNGSSGL